jgi:signal transduction histidine kinase
MMAPAESAGNGLRVLLLAPTRRDEEVTAKALAAAGVACERCASLRAVIDALASGVGAVMLTDLALTDPQFGVLVAALQQQPPWSSVPLLLLCRDREHTPALQHLTRQLGNITLLDRPSSLRSMISAVQACLRGRQWQYQIRDHMVAQQQAEEALRQADQRKDAFLATLAHELRNPLSPIKTGLQLLRRSPGPTGPRPGLLDMMDRQVSQLVKLIDELLDVSRIATGKVVLQRELADMGSVLALAVEGSQPAIDAAGHRLRVSLPPQPPCVVGDPSRLAQAVGNLLNNAAKYTPAGGDISLTLAQEGPQAVVTVSDTGIGIPPDMLSQVFELFAQVDRTLDRCQGGLGIGLSLVRSLVELHGGSVTASSAGTDQGSSFQIRLPAVVADGAAPTPDAPHRNGADTAVQRMRILVVDDNADAADTMAMLLRADGHAVQVAYNAAQALEAAQGFLPEAVFCDLGMRGMSGHEFAAHVRRDRRLGAALLVAITGWGGEEDQRRSRAAGFDHHLTKPASIDSIEAILSRR